eukprot:365691-Chlamydomonas_euryale.AAC.10
MPNCPGTGKAGKRDEGQGEREKWGKEGRVGASAASRAGGLVSLEVWEDDQLPAAAGAAEGVGKKGGADGGSMGRWKHHRLVLRRDPQPKALRRKVAE